MPAAQKETPTAATVGALDKQCGPLSTRTTGQERATVPALAQSLTPPVSRMRQDVTAVKRMHDGKKSASWRPNEPLTPTRLHEHVSGHQARGVALMLPGSSTTRAAVLDFDSHEGQTPWDDMMACAQRVAVAAQLFGLQPVAWRSGGGRGVHLWFLWDDPQDAHSVRVLLRQVLQACGLDDRGRTGGVAAGVVEVYPKQDHIPPGGFGNQVFLPLAGQSVPLDLDLGMVLDREAALGLAWPCSEPVPVVAAPVRQVSERSESADPIEKVSTALHRIPTEALDYADWHKLLCAVHEATEGSEDGLDLMQDWGAAYPRHNFEFVEREWRRLKDDRTGGATRASLYGKAAAHGWTLGPVPSAEGFTDAGPLAELLALPHDQLLAQWPAVALTLDPLSAEALREDVHQRTGAGKRALSAQLREERARQAEASRKRTTGTRTEIQHAPEDSYAQAAQVGGLILKNAPPDAYPLVLHAGRAARVTFAPPARAHAVDDEDAPPPDQVLIETHSTSSMIAEAERVAVFTVPTKDGARPIAQPAQVVQHLVTGDPAGAPVVHGLSAHPFVTHEGDIVATNGLHTRSGILVHGCDVDQPRAYTRDAARDALQWLRVHFLAGFEFRTALDMDAALAGLFTAVQRPILDMAPGLAILAAAQSSGKTTLARRVHLVVTGRDAPIQTLRLGDDAETEKAILSVLLQAPPMLIYDNVPDGMTLDLGPLNAVLTAPTFEGRVLGSSRMLRVSTATALVVTGNNLRLGPDETSRMLVAHLAPATARAETRTFRHPDVQAHALRIRADALHHVVGIVAGWLQSGGKLDLSEGSRFAQWDRHVRQAIVWAGGQDVAAVFRHNDQQAEHLQALRQLLRELRLEFGALSFAAREVCDRCVSSLTDQGRSVRVRDALENLRVRDVTSARSVGRALTAALDRSVEMDGATLRLQGRVDRDGISRFVVRAL